MTEYGPSAIRAVFDAAAGHLESARLSGIVGDAAHTYGYHRGRNFVADGDYSAKLALDLAGDGEAASALDITLSDAEMQLVTLRLLAAAKAGDPRLAAVREFSGTTDGKVTHSYDLSTGREAFGEWDASHLWHVHLSFYRKYVNDEASLRLVAEVLAGIAAAVAEIPVIPLEDTDEMYIITPGTTALPVLLIGGKAVSLKSGKSWSAFGKAGVQTVQIDPTDYAAIRKACT